MSWENINSQRYSDKKKIENESNLKNAKQKDIDLCKLYSRLFNTKDGQAALSDLTSKMIYSNDVSLTSENINYVAAYKNGEAGAIKYIINKIMRGANG